MGWIKQGFFISVFGLSMLTTGSLLAQENNATTHLASDSDHDGLADSLEQALLAQFAPRFMIAEHDCSNMPASFQAGAKTPQATAENGTIYGQVFPVKGSGGTSAEIHYYHLWRKDCGGHGHPLDTEHVALLVRASETNTVAATWKALYWYAAAHENTVCDVSQVARASTLHAEDHGATIWVSPGKHASYLDPTLCHGGCGADRCERMVAMPSGKLVNLGEPDFPMSGSLFIESSAWPLRSKMATTNFPAATVVRVAQLTPGEIAWYNPGRHPAQGVIAISSSTEQALAGSGQNTAAAVSTARDSTGEAVSTASDSTANALDKSYRHTRHALGLSARQVGKALHVIPDQGASKPR